MVATGKRSDRQIGFALAHWLLCKRSIEAATEVNQIEIGIYDVSGVALESGLNPVRKDGFAVSLDVRGLRIQKEAQNS